MSDFVTGFYTKDGVKKYDYNALANLPEAGTDITNTVISPNADYAEVGEWADGNPDGENRLGYFVSIAEVGDNTIKIRKATSEDDVRGVSVYNPAFSGNASKDKYGADGELLPQYNYIGVMGIVQTIDNGRCTVGGRCMPDDDGTAIPSDNNMGYAVLERVDSRHVLIAVEPGADMIQRVKTDIKRIEEQLEEGGGGSGSGLTPEQLEQFNALVDWYNESTYTMMTASIYSSSPTNEIGSTKTITFNWTFKVGTKAAELSSLTFKGNSLPVTQTSATVENITSSGTYTVSGTRKDGQKETKEAKAYVYFYNKYYFGYAADPGELSDAEYSTFIKKLTTDSKLQGSRPTFTKTKTVNCPANQYVWLAYPSRLGASSFKVNGFNGNFEEPIVVTEFENNSGYKEEYYLYRSTEHSLGLIDELVVY